MMRDESNITPNMGTLAQKMRTFKQVRNTVLHEQYYFLRTVGETSEGYAFHVDFAKGECGGRLTGLFTETGVAGMLKASD